RDVAEAEKFYGLFGLDTKEEGGKLGLYTQGHPHRWFTVSEGPRKKLNYVSFGAFEYDLPRFRERLEKMRIDRLDPPKGFESNGLWFRDPDGTLVEIRVAEKSSPNEKATFEMKGGDVGRQNSLNRSKVHKVAPPRAHPAFHPGHPQGHRLLPRCAGASPVRPFRRPDRVHARHPRQRPPHD